MFKFTTSVLTILGLVGSTGSAFANPESNTLLIENGNGVPVPQVIDNTTTSSSTGLAEGVAFGCEISEGIPVTFVKINSDSGQQQKSILYWVSKHFPDPIQAQELCENVARKLQSAYSSNGLKDMGIYAGKIDVNMPKQYVLCLKQTEGTSCNAQDLILFAGQTNCLDPKAVLYDMGSREIVDTKQRPLCSGTKGDFTTRLLFNWLPF
jgi:hypothetical protein